MLCIILVAQIFFFVHKNVIQEHNHSNSLVLVSTTNVPEVRWLKPCSIWNHHDKRKNGWIHLTGVDDGDGMLHLLCTSTRVTVPFHYVKPVMNIMVVGGEMKWGKSNGFCIVHTNNFTCKYTGDSQSQSIAVDNKNWLMKTFKFSKNMEKYCIPYFSLLLHKFTLSS